MIHGSCLFSPFILSDILIISALIYLILTRKSANLCFTSTRLLSYHFIHAAKKFVTFVRPDAHLIYIHFNLGNVQHRWAATQTLFPYIYSYISHFFDLYGCSYLHFQRSRLLSYNFLSFPILLCSFCYAFPLFRLYFSL